MQFEFLLNWPALLIWPACLLVGFVGGFGVRALISHRRRRRSRVAYWQEGALQSDWRLERPRAEPQTLPTRS